MKIMHDTFKGYRVVVDERCDIYDAVPIRTHRKKRLRKKFLKKYGSRNVLVASDSYITKDRMIVMGRLMYEELRKQAIKQDPKLGGIY